MEPTAEILGGALAAAFERCAEARVAKAYEPLAPPTPDQARELTKQLLASAIANGLPVLSEGPLQTHELEGGMSSELILRVSRELSAVTKCGNDRAVVTQALAIARLKHEERVGDRWSRLLPAVYVVKSDGPPFAYMMEHFGAPAFTRLWDLIEESPDSARTANKDLVLEMVALHKSSFQKRLVPRPKIDYLARIVERLEEAEEFGPAFPIISSTVVLNDKPLPTWREVVDRLDESIRHFDPAGVSSIHGDLHPLNVFVGRDGSLRLIDPKTWTIGDCALDLGKCLHFLEVQRHMPQIVGSLTVTVSGGRTLVTEASSYKAAAEGLTGPWRLAVAELARELPDSTLVRRVPLAIATSLLGQVPMRVRRGQRREGIVDYVLGLSLLSDCASGPDSIDGRA